MAACTCFSSLVGLVVLNLLCKPYRHPLFYQLSFLCLWQFYCSEIKPIHAKSICSYIEVVENFTAEFLGQPLVHIRIY